MKLTKVLESAVENNFSNFYRNKYVRDGFDYKTIRSGKDLSKIPFLKREEIIAVPVEERTMVPSESVVYYSISSGTIDSTNPLIVPHSEFGPPAKLGVDRIYDENLNIKRLFFLMPSSAPSLMRLIFPMKELGKVLLPGNIHDLDLSAKIASQVKIDAIFSTPTILSLFIGSLKKIGIDPRSIKLILIRGEFCSIQKINLFKEFFSEAEIDIKYGSSEIGGAIGYRCPHLRDFTPNVYHPLSKGIVESVEDEIVYTDLSPIKAFPLIRYRTGDAGTLESIDCPCGNKALLRVGGRIGFDKIKFHGVTLYVESLEDSFAEAMEYMEPGQFKAHVTEKTIDGKIMPQISIKIGLKEEVETSDFLKGVISRSVSDRLYLSSNKSLSDLVKLDIFLPLELTLTKKWPCNLKSKYITSDI